MDPCVMDREADSAGSILWLVDGFNVLHMGVLQGTERGQWWRESTRERLLELVRGFEEPAAEIWVAFDGPHPALSQTGRVHVVFAPSADAWILARLRELRGATEEAEPSRVSVVTGDRQLADRSRHRGARVVKPHEFLARCRGEPEAPG